jgi:hypothetical protein
MNAITKADQIESDLQSEKRDVVFRAMVFLSRNGGPTIASEEMTNETLGDEAAKAIAWYQTLENKEEMLNKYPEHILQWNPVFQDRSDD